MTIRIYPSLLEGEPLETHEWQGTFAGWLDSKGLGFRAREQQPISVQVNGEALAFAQWESLELSSSDDVKVRPLAHGGVFNGLGKILNAVFGWLMPKSGGNNEYNAPGQGSQLESSQAKANRAKLGEAVPELAGRFRRFPDYLTPPRRYFASPREQWLEFHACIGPGAYEINQDDVKVGDTPFASLVDNGQYQIYDPGEDLSSVPTHEHWHTVEEVGGTSSGTAGLELSTELANRENTQPAAYHFDGTEIVRSSGQWPAGWGAGTAVYVEYSSSYDVATINVTPVGDNPYNISEITGYFGHLASGPQLGELIELGPLNASTQYRVASVVDNGSGSYTIRLRDAVNNDPIVMTPGLGQTLIFGASQFWDITSILGDTMEVSGNGAFELVTIAGSKVVYAGGDVYGEWSNEYVATPGNELTNVLELDFFLPQGLGYIYEDGSIGSITTGVEVSYRDLRGGNSTSVLYSFSASTLDQIGYTRSMGIPTMIPAVKVRRVGNVSTDRGIRDVMHWYGLKSKLPTRTSYPNWTTMMVRLRSGGQLAAQSENQINVIATRMLQTLQPDGTWGASQPTRDISAFVRHIAHSIGYTDDNIDMDELLRLHNLWTSRGETCDTIFDQTTVKEALNVVLGAGMAELTVADGQIRPVRDGVRTSFEQSYSPQNMTGPLRRVFRAKRHDDHDGAEVEYTDSETWTQQTIVCALPGSPKAKLEKIKLEGVTDRTRAWRIGMRRAREQAHQRWEYSFGTEMDAFNSEYGSYVALFDDVPGYGQSALLRHIQPDAGGALLHVTEPLRWEEGQTHMVAYRKPDGTLAGPWLASPGPDDYSLVAPIPAPWPQVSLKQELPHVYFGVAERFTFPALIRDIRPNGMEAANAVAVNYDVRVYADDDNSPT